jgi:8-oxo-dGTP diphosphatase
MNDKYIDKLAFVYIKDRQLLSTLSTGKDTWYIPGGKREEGESDLEALSREVKEELLVDINVDTVKLYGVFEAQAHGKAEGMIVRMTCYEADFDGELHPSAEVERMAFVNYDWKERSSDVDKLIFDDLKAKNLID